MGSPEIHVNVHHGLLLLCCHHVYVLLAGHVTFFFTVQRIVGLNSQKRMLAMLQEITIECTQAEPPAHLT